MENRQNLQVFNFKNQQVDVIIINSEPHFIGKQVATILGYTNPQKAVRDHIDAEDRRAERIVRPFGGAQDTVIINESGLYSLILGSKLEKAKKVKRWVSSEVLPSIRKTGKYGIQTETDEELIARALIAAIFVINKLQNRVVMLEERVAVQNQQSAEINPKVAYYDIVLNNKDLTSITTIAKDYSISGREMNKILHELGIQ